MVISWEQLRDAREYASFTQAELAKELGVSVRTIVNWEADGGNGVPRKMERRVLDVLGNAMETLTQHVYPLRDVPASPVDEAAAAEAARVNREARELDEARLKRLGIRDERQIAESRRREALSAFTMIDLLDEVRDRALKDGEKATDWSTRAVDLRERARRRDVGGRVHDDVLDDETRYAADTQNETPDEDYRQP